jgi:SNF2 family DNA or RNA helicase
VIVMTVQTGGSGLNLESANSAHLLDEPWDPDQQYQFFGRGDRGSRTTPLRCYTYRTPNSIQEYIAAVAGEKKITNNNVLRFAPQIEALRR